MKRRRLITKPDSLISKHLGLRLHIVRVLRNVAGLPRDAVTLHRGAYGYGASRCPYRGTPQQ